MCIRMCGCMCGCVCVCVKCVHHETRKGILREFEKETIMGKKDTKSEYGMGIPRKEPKINTLISSKWLSAGCEAQ